MFGNSNLPAIFLTGLLTGGLTCIAIQGGLLTSALSQTLDQKLKIKDQKRELIPVLGFIIAKLVAYTILGFLLGLLGSLIQVSIQVRIILQFAVVIFMLGTAFNLLNIHPIFRYFIISPPFWLIREAYKQSESRNLFAPIFLGFLTVLIPCGATQAMMALAVTSGSAIVGAVILFVFILGTSPVFLLLGLLTVKLKSAINRKFIKAAAIGIILLAIFNLDATLALANSPFTISSFMNNTYCVFSYCDLIATPVPVTEQIIKFSTTGYSPNHFAVNKGSKVTLHLINENATGCIQAFTISSLNIQKIVLPNQSDIVEFTAPDQPGRITFTCSAGLYPGTIEVV